MSHATLRLHRLLGELVEFVSRHNCESLRPGATARLRMLDRQIASLCVEAGVSIPEIEKSDRFSSLGHCRVPFNMARVLAISRPIKTTTERRIGRTMIVYAHRPWVTAIEKLRATLSQELL